MEPTYTPQHAHLMAQQQAFAAHHQLHPMQGQMSPPMHPLGPPMHPMHPQLMLLTHAMPHDPHHMHPQTLAMQDPSQTYGAHAPPPPDMSGHLRTAGHHLPRGIPSQESIVLQHVPHEAQVMGQHVGHEAHSQTHFMPHVHHSLQPQMHGMVGAHAHAVHSQEHGAMQMAPGPHHQGVPQQLEQHPVASSGVAVPGPMQNGIYGHGQIEMGFHHPPMQTSIPPHMHPGVEQPLVSSDGIVVPYGPPGSDQHASNGTYAGQPGGLMAPSLPQSTALLQQTPSGEEVKDVGISAMQPLGVAASMEIGVPSAGLAVSAEQGGQGLAGAGENGVSVMACHVSGPMTLPNVATAPHPMGLSGVGYMEPPLSVGMLNLDGNYGMLGFGCQGADPLALPQTSLPPLPVAATQASIGNLDPQSSGTLLEAVFPPLPVGTTEGLGEQPTPSEALVSCTGNAHSQVLAGASGQA
jgi:hypothetical protein